MAAIDITALRLRLLACGYTPLPACGKEVYLPGWPTIVPTPQDVAHWPAAHSSSTNTGITTRNTPAIDIDILDPIVATMVDNLATSQLGNTGVVLRRVGRAPKRAILFQTSEPFDKRWAVFTAPDGKTHRIEILARGQQVIAYGIHPDTRQPYLWQPAGPLQVKRSQLPLLTAKAADLFMAAATALLTQECGWTVKTQPKSDTAHCTSYAQFDVRAVAGIINTVANAIEGNRNDVTYWAACRAGEMVKAGWFTRETARDVLLDAALKVGLPAHSALATIRSGLRTTMGT